MSSTIVYCVSCGNSLKPSTAYRMYVDEKVEVPWSTPQNPIYKGGEPIFVCSKKCHDAFKMNMKEFGIQMVNIDSIGVCRVNFGAFSQ